MGNTREPTGAASASGDTSQAAGGSAASGGGTAAGGGAPAEQATAASPAAQVPAAAAPPRVAAIVQPGAARAGQTAAALRPGGDGGDTVVRARESLDDAQRLDRALAAEVATDADEARARRYAEAAQNRLIAQELLSRLPVPVEAMPSLGAEVERVVEARAPRQPAVDRAA
ncbi:hypothetical protein [Jannaschia rubra]|nr:hypothetical protein [Jannaschia rubra]